MSVFEALGWWPSSAPKDFSWLRFETEYWCLLAIALVHGRLCSSSSSISKFCPVCYGSGSAMMSSLVHRV